MGESRDGVVARSPDARAKPPGFESRSCHSQTLISLFPLLQNCDHDRTYFQRSLCRITELKYIIASESVLRAIQGYNRLQGICCYGDDGLNSDRGSQQGADSSAQSSKEKRTEGGKAGRRDGPLPVAAEVSVLSPGRGWAFSSLPAQAAAGVAHSSPPNLAQ